MANFAEPQPHTAGIVAGVTTVSGLAIAAASNPPHGWLGWAMFALAGVGSVLQAFTKPVHAGDTDIVPAAPSKR